MGLGALPENDRSLRAAGMIASCIDSFSGLVGNEFRSLDQTGKEAWITKLANQINHGGAEAALNHVFSVHPGERTDSAVQMVTNLVQQYGPR